jgi:hypothetical protein
MRISYLLFTLWKWVMECAEIRAFAQLIGTKFDDRCRLSNGTKFHWVEI